ncbi:hypothetical protein GPLA_3766 [Paraglaciecola polaris LMG 21857]|uniref:Uncharacterized protein n=1 Tax=Paraglaciecola polaris LMG 21857 TaxID=1129793 RepID=K6ZF12_9ALTE|nr:hypothetical protein GPLA_3766 [Paraglaciecola polaris LMG 21857]
MTLFATDFGWIVATFCQFQEVHEAIFGMLPIVKSSTKAVLF